GIRDATVTGVQTCALPILLGYSINTLTLFGMVLAIGIVVDDAIVVLENVERIMHEEHLNAREAAVKAMAEVTSPIIAIVLVLCRSEERRVGNGGGCREQRW